MGLGESGKIAFAYKDHDAGTMLKAGSYSGPDPTDAVRIKSSWIAGQYTIGSMTAFLGVGRTKITDTSKVDGMATDLQSYLGAWQLTPTLLKPYVEHKQTNSTTFAGVRGSVGDTGISYVFQARSKKSKGTHGGSAYTPATANDDAVPGIQAGADVPKNGSSPWLLALSRSLGGGASVHFEHDNPDNGTKSTSYLALKVDF